MKQGKEKGFGIEINLIPKSDPLLWILISFAIDLNYPNAIDFAFCGSL